MIKLCALLGLFFLYGMFGSPTPDNPSYIEAAIALLLIISIGWSGLSHSFQFSFRSDSYLSPYLFIKVFLVFGLSVPVIIGLTNPPNLNLMLRDIIAFLFLLLPVFFIPLIQNEKKLERALLIGIVSVGAVFSLRTFFPAMPVFPQTEELLYLSNSPFVLFAAVYVMGCVFTYLSKPINAHNSVLSLFYLSLMALIILALMQDTQRAPIAALIVSFLFLFFVGLIRRPKTLFKPALFILIAVVFALPYVSEVIDPIIHKTYSVGFNMRFEELRAVWERASMNITTLIFGTGWGGQFESPAVGGLSVTYTHSLLSYMLLKTGVLGLFLTLSYLGILFRKTLIVLQEDRVVGIALLWAFIIPVFLYASYKSLDFGLLLTLLVCFSKAQDLGQSSDEIKQRINIKNKSTE